MVVVVVVEDTPLVPAPCKETSVHTMSGVKPDRRARKLPFQKGPWVAHGNFIHIKGI